MGKTIRLTMAQAVTHFLTKQMTVIDGQKLPIFGGVWAIFGHGNVAGIGEALYQVRDELTTYRAHNEQGMAHAAIAYAKASFRQRFMACTSSIGPGALNMVTAAGVAHVNRIPVLFLPGDVFANRAPDPVLQQIEDFGDGTVSANDAFRSVSRYFDRITRPEQIITALKRAMQVLTDPFDCGPVTLSLCQDVQAEAFDYPESFFEERIWTTRRPQPDADELAAAIALIRKAEKPVIIAGGGVLYSRATKELTEFAETHGVPVVVSQAGKSAIDERHPLALGSVGVTGTSAANAIAEGTDLIIAVGTRCQDFTTGSWALFKNEKLSILGLNIAAYDASKHDGRPLVCDAREGLKALSAGLAGWRAPAALLEKATQEKKIWVEAAAKAMASTNTALPSDAQVIGAVTRTIGGENAISVCAAGGLPGELHKLWPATVPGSYHMEYGFSCMGYEIAGGLGTKMACPEKDVIVMVGDGSYMMLNSEIATSVMLGLKLNIVLLDNRGYGCINRLQMETGGANFNNLLKDSYYEVMPEIDFRAHAESMGAIAVKVASIAELEQAIEASKKNDRTTVFVIDTDPLITTSEGGHWWDVVVPEVSPRPQVNKARAAYEQARGAQRIR
ncbi:3D-(3,5/4)-trihydroxycyclohexane-1,2-dione acylhydrolase (decyclizing) [Agrobacterium rhizogenes]|uniref:3D-(3,5/4)-trihydroxycyclohexane-1,2-dione acylhydrolase (decyclizing) n=1 Tax=Rhizobium rhizogenes TaxID=359 RepID=UPI00055EF6DB|nr:3D-(3,5/4)-trihydroxycyclohexane-1,2-dione acylhydrolase (decyclizing) [Rhizobium rhizogenes]NTF80520.1 3D-(3,5/4)-trihydroxycyclohexane-1,2-dione acylhydrolase (decyclizing) [Rhizobium rhizogenes]NTH76612.1 3D-(3,5/4)-trihydroxycyclohexane-1,2-dione acylhydrolase (decyclizing) [Rhizobium rhizogenes]NTH82620.1 3D-(3,5/4)-trihydroxycyclohexane-1,2-dione acylhydrolase (decyclizing) [Rhizobium rhizogenes]NTI61000.1 3D-(3,5/4)-trihydroxycyclohexane-1,2-dione acylhydrolase (decyclizing) [Rhizobiu